MEVFYNGTWGTVCDDFWELDDARVVCRELGYEGVVSAHGNAHFGRGTGEIWLDNVECTGSESKLGLCDHKGVGDHNCNHGEDAGVVCQSEYMLITKYLILKVTQIELLGPKYGKW